MLPISMYKEVSPAVARALDFALTNVGVCEDPPGSNRGPEIDLWAREFGSPLGSYWCALAVAKARSIGGLWIPRTDAGSCNEWIYQGRHASVMSHTPVPGACVMYTNHHHLTDGRYAGQLDAVHMGLVLRVTPRLMALEGNTTLGKYDRNGFVLALKEVDLARVLCYILPEPMSGGAQP